MKDILTRLRAASRKRQKEFCPDGKFPPISFAFMELAGEAGEACNAGKKLARHDLSMVGGTDDITNLKEELADVIISVDLIAMRYNIDLTKEIPSKFNKTSKKFNFKTRLK